MSRFLYRLGRFSSRHRRWVVAAWVIAVVGLFVVGKVAGGETHDSFSVPGVESQRATDLLTASFPTQAGGSAQVVFHSTDGTLADPGNAAAMDPVCVYNPDHGLLETLRLPAADAFPMWRG